MALAPFFLGGSEIFDPFNLDSFLFGGQSAGSGNSATDGGRGGYARDLVAVANTQVDWKETPDSHIFKANLPGLSKDDVKVQVEDGHVLQISGERKKEETTSGDKWRRVERVQGTFLRRFRLPDNAKVEEVKAAMENGVLTVTVPKQVHKPAPRAIDITCS